MKSIAKILFISAVCLLFVPQQTGAEEVKGKSLIEKVCQGTNAKDLCTAILLSDPRSLQETENGLAMIALNVASKNATDIINHVKVLDGDDSLDPNVEQALNDCQDTFEDAQDQITDAIGSLVAGNTKDAQKWLQAGLAASDTCENSLRGNEHILLNKTETFRKLCSIALSIIQNLPSSK
ncbi:hypothetical protein L6164_010242 [Bauhinia variegata]|uniref:Uncharacterized protein n=1 Tax=Bauhinia variegata TaxID=167791 RepID=A0ACB9PNP4_BAUVA|nr:hypothetical protein L6164_010242 [Bauhinia variegata]